MHNKV